jgi:Tfp pilus assembly protein PilN
VIAPNLASRPFLNTRPVWLLTGACVVLTVTFGALNVLSYVRSNRTLAPVIERRAELDAIKSELERSVRGEVQRLEGVPWKSLADRVRDTNVVLRERNFSWIRLLDDVERVMPYQVRMVTISPGVSTEGVSLSLAVVAQSRDAMLELLENLIADPSFSQPMPLREGLPETARTAEYELSLNVTYHPGGRKP